MRGFTWDLLRVRAAFGDRAKGLPRLRRCSWGRAEWPPLLELSLRPALNRTLRSSISHSYRDNPRDHALRRLFKIFAEHLIHSV